VLRLTARWPPWPPFPLLSWSSILIEFSLPFFSASVSLHDLLFFTSSFWISLVGFRSRSPFPDFFWTGFSFPVPSNFCIRDMEFLGLLCRWDVFFPLIFGGLFFEVWTLSYSVFLRDLFQSPKALFSLVLPGDFPRVFLFFPRLVYGLHFSAFLFSSFTPPHKSIREYFRAFEVVGLSFLVSSPFLSGPSPSRKLPVVRRRDPALFDWI